MRIAFYSPFKPLNHPRISGDVTIARDMAAFFLARGHSIREVSTLNGEWIYRRPGRWPKAAMEMHRAAGNPRRFDCWLTYQTYYRAPDLLGPVFSRAGHPRRPYFIFSGTYATKRRKTLATLPGYHLNRKALLAADHIFSNKREKHDGLLRLIEGKKCSCLRPGIRTDLFSPDPGGGQALRKSLGLDKMPVVVTAAMLRPGVKTEGVEWVIRACGRIRARGRGPGLIIIGDGPGRPGLEALARNMLGENVHFLGLLDRHALPAAYSAGDLFAFPGIDENLGMVYLEAQCCGLPVVAFDCGGASEVVADGKTGRITPAMDLASFAEAIRSLLADTEARRAMSGAARTHVLANHDIFHTYTVMEKRMHDMVTAMARGAVDAK